MAAIVIYPGFQVTQDPSAVKVYVFDWDLLNLPTTVGIATSTFRVSGISPSYDDVALTLDQDARLTAAEASAALDRTVTGDFRATRVRVSSGTMHQVYEVVNRIVTDETPAQTKEKSFRILVEQE